MSQFLRPDGDVVLGGWSNPSFSVIDEVTRNDSDETTTGNNPSSDTLEVSTSDTSSPDAGTRTFRYTYKKTGTKTLNLTVELREGTTVVETSTHSNIGTTYVQNNFTVVGSITDYTNVNFRFIANVSGGGAPSSCQVSWAEFEIPNSSVVELTQDLSDNIGTLADSLEPNLGYIISQSENLGNLLDSLNIVYALNLSDSDSIDNWLDSLNLSLESRLILSENMNNLQDSHILSLNPVGGSELTVDVSDNMNNLQDSLESKFIGHMRILVNSL